MSSSSKTVVFGGEMRERIIDRKTGDTEQYGVVYTKTAMSDRSKSCGIEIVNTSSTPDVIRELLSCEPVQLGYSNEFKPFDAIFEEMMFPGYRNKPAFRATRLVRTWESKEAFPVLPEIDVMSLYDSLPIPDGMDVDASRRLAYGVIVGSKKFAMNGKEFFQFNMLQPFDDSQPDTFGYSALYGSMSKTIFNWHMKERGAPFVVLMDGYNKIGRSHADVFFGVKLYTLEEVFELLGIANAAGGSPPLPTDETALTPAVDSSSDVSPVPASAAVPDPEIKPVEEPAPEKPARGNPFKRGTDTGSNG